jgi:hypothetical protein
MIRPDSTVSPLPEPSSPINKNEDENVGVVLMEDYIIMKVGDKIIVAFSALADS